MSIKYFYNFSLKGIDEFDLTGDILTGVRRSFFENSDKIRDRITLNSDADSISYEYTIEKDKPMRWVAKTADGVIQQEIMLSDEGKYYLYFYRDETLYKRLLFSKYHTLLRAEYFDPETNIPVYSLEPRRSTDGLCLLFISRKEPLPIVLSAFPDISDPRVAARIDEFEDYTAAASTNDGVIRFLSDEQSEHLRSFIDQVIAELEVQTEESFIGDDMPLYDKINAKDFNVKRNLSASLDITLAKDFMVDTTSEDAAPLAQEQAIDAASDLNADDTPDQSAVTEDVADLAAAGIQPDKMIMADGAMYSYFGELDPFGNRSGYGRTLTEYGRTAYEGCYENDKRSGNGSYYYKDGTLCYTGDWLENARHGVGVGVSSNDGSFHVGNWCNNKPAGTGVRLTADGDIKFVCKELADGMTVLMNYMPDDTVIISKYDEKGKKLSEKTVSLAEI